jgi:hypothetical protein
MLTIKIFVSYLYQYLVTNFKIEVFYNVYKEKLEKCKFYIGFGGMRYTSVCNPILMKGDKFG